MLLRKNAPDGSVAYRLRRFFQSEHAVHVLHPFLSGHAVIPAGVQLHFPERLPVRDRHRIFHGVAHHHGAHPLVQFLVEPLVQLRLYLPVHVVDPAVHLLAFLALELIPSRAQGLKLRLLLLAGVPGDCIVLHFPHVSEQDLRVFLREILQFLREALHLPLRGIRIPVPVLRQHPLRLLQALFLLPVCFGPRFELFIHGLQRLPVLVLQTALQNTSLSYHAAQAIRNKTG